MDDDDWYEPPVHFGMGSLYDLNTHPAPKKKGKARTKPRMGFAIPKAPRKGRAK